MQFKRKIHQSVEERLGGGKAIVLIGPRQVGKTTLLREILKNKDFLFLNGDDPTVRQILNSPNTQEIQNIIGEKKFVFIDEAQSSSQRTCKQLFVQRRSCVKRYSKSRSFG